MLQYNNAYLGDGTLSVPPQNRVLPDLDPANVASDREKFYKRVRSKIIALHIEGFLTKDAWSDILTDKDKFAWCDSNGDVFYDGPMIIKVMRDACNPDTKVGVQVLRNKITNANSAGYAHDIPKMLKDIKMNMDLIRDLGETHDNLLEDAFNALLSAPNSRFVDYFDKQKLAWQGGTVTCTFQTLSETAKSMCNNM